MKSVRRFLSTPEKHNNSLESTRQNDNQFLEDDCCIELWGETGKRVRIRETEVGLRVICNESQSVAAWTGSQNDRKF